MQEIIPNQQRIRYGQNNGTETNATQTNGQNNRPETNATQTNGKSNEQETSTDQQELHDERLKDFGQTILPTEDGKRIRLISIIGEIEGHESLPKATKATKYDHLLPLLAEIENDSSTGGVLILIHTAGGDVEAGLAIAEMITSLSKPTVSLVLGGSHSIGVPLAVSADYSFIVPSANMMIHPVRMTGMMIGVSQTYLYFERIQERILTFITDHSDIEYEKLKEYMLDTSQLAKDVGTILDGKEAVRSGLIDEIGGIREAVTKLKSLL